VTWAGYTAAAGGKEAALRRLRWFKENLMSKFGLSILSRRIVIYALACLAAAVNGFAAAEEMVVVRREDAKFVPLDPARPDEFQIAVLWGDPTTGPSSAFIRARKYTGPLHYHTFAYDVVILEGQMKHWGEGQREEDVPPLGPGSYWRQPGLQPHSDSCLTDVCLAFIKWEGKWDGFVVIGPK
jgi:hypothetical protein